LTDGERGEVRPRRNGEPLVYVALGTVAASTSRALKTCRHYVKEGGVLLEHLLVEESKLLDHLTPEVR
jgi:hypothetical protein